MKKRKFDASLIAIPKSLRQKMLGFLDPQHVAVFRTVCHEFESDRAMWRGLRMMIDYPIYTNLFVSGYVRMISIDGSSATCMHALAHAALAYEPREIKFDETCVRDVALRLIPEFNSLEKLTLFNCDKLTDKGLAHVAKASWLKALDIGKSRFTEAGLAHVSKLRELVALDLRKLNIARLDRLVDLPLKRLNLWECAKLTDAAMQSVALITTLEKLDLGECAGLSDESLLAVAKLINLRALSLYKCKWLTEKGLEHLSVLQKLDFLGLGFTGTTDVGLSHMRHMNLREIDLRECKVTDVGANLLALMPKLVQVQVKGANVSASMIAYLVACGVRTDPLSLIYF